MSIPNSSLDLLEQHQAREQARLLQRFRELREWQQVQQQQLMQQQKQQLRSWQDEQSKVQTLLASHGGLKPSAGGTRSPRMTPPTKPRPSSSQAPLQPSFIGDSLTQSQVAGLSLDSGLVVSMQDTLKSQSSLPRPVMYPPQFPAGGNVDGADDDKYTNSELFSNLGSQDDKLMEEVDEQKQSNNGPLPDWMSDTSSNFLRGSQLPPPRPNSKGVNSQLAGLEQLLSTAPAGLLQQMLGLLPAGAGGVGHSSDVVELSASPALPPPGSQNAPPPPARRLLDYQAALGGDSAGGASPELSGSQTVAALKRQGQQILHQRQQEQSYQAVSGKQMPAYNSDSSPFIAPAQLGPHMTETSPDDSWYVPRAFSLRDQDVDQVAVRTRGRDLLAEADAAGRSGEGHQQMSDDEESYYDDGDSDESFRQAEKPTRHEDRPISGTAGKKTFEQLLEEQLQQEQQKQRQQANAEASYGAPKKATFLKKGEGIARFNSAPKKPPPRRKSSTKPQQHRESAYSSDMSSQGGGGNTSVSRRSGADGKRTSVGSRLRGGAAKTVENGTAVPDRKTSTAPEKSHGQTELSSRGVDELMEDAGATQAAKLSLIRNAASRKLEEQNKQMQQEHQKYMREQQQLQQQNSSSKVGQQGAGVRKFGDLSTIIEQSPSMDARSNMTDDHDSTELDSLAEFEALEDAADNLSMCSSSSLVGRLLHGDKQGQKEAVQRLKTITESVKSARGEKTSSGLGEQFGSSANLNSNNINNMAAAANLNSNNSNINNMAAASRVSSTNGNRHGGLSSPDVTLTDSSDEEITNIDRVLARQPQNDCYGERASQSDGDHDKLLSQQNCPASPSKVLTRKVAPLSSKFSAANDTLSLLKSLSMQANSLTSAPKPATTVLSSSSSRALLPNLPQSSAQDASSLTQTTTQPSGSTIDHLDFFSSSNNTGGPSTLPPNFFSSSANNATSMAKDGTILTSCLFGPSVVQTFQASSDLVTSTAPSFSFQSLGTKSTQRDNTKYSSGDSQDSSNSGGILPNGKSYHSGKYATEGKDTKNGDSDTDASSDTTKGGQVEGDSDDDDDDDTWKEDNSNSKQTGSKDGNAEEKNADYANGGFDDESAWEDEEDHEAFDNATSLKRASGTPTRVRRSLPNGKSNTPPTSKLVSKLFPKLKPKPSADAEKKKQSLQEASGQPVTNNTAGIQSSILRDKLRELDAEIERFRSENANLEKLRREREEGVSKLKQEIESFQKEKELELKRLEEFKSEETKKLKREKKLFETYQKKVRSMPDKREREEIENMKTQLEETQEEMKRKESRWTATTARLKNRVAELELENGELKEEVRILERKRLEWMSNNQGSNRPNNGRLGGPSSIGGTSATGSSQQGGGPRSSTPTGDMVQQAVGTQMKNTSRSTSSALQPKPSAGTSNNHMNNNSKGKPSSAATAAASTTISSKSGGGSRTSAPANRAVSARGGALQQGKINGASAPSSTVIAPSVPVTTLSRPSQQTSASGSSRDGGGEGLQSMAVPVMMECTIPEGTQESSMPGLQPNNRSASPDKSAARVAIEKAVVDKGDPSVFTENRHQDGKLEKTFRTGAKEIHFPNGTVKEISADGQTIVCRLANGDIRQIFPDHRVVYIFSEAQIMQTTFPDGLETFQFQNGQIERRYPDGTVEITFPSKDIKYLFPDGGQEIILTNGTVMQYNSRGERTVEYPSGDREVHTAEFQRREFPDGIVKTIYADGRHETRFPNGRVRMRDKDGNVVMDQIVYR